MIYLILYYIYHPQAFFIWFYDNEKSNNYSKFARDDIGVIEWSKIVFSKIEHWHIVSTLHVFAIHKLKSKNWR